MVVVVVALVLAAVVWGLVAVRARLLGWLPGRAPSITAPLGDDADQDDAPRTRPTIDDVESWLAWTVLVALAFAMAHVDGSPPMRGLVLVGGFVLVAWLQERTARAPR